MGVQRARSDESQCRRENTNKSHSVPCCTRMERGGGTDVETDDGREIIDFFGGCTRSRSDFGLAMPVDGWWGRLRCVWNKRVGEVLVGRQEEKERRLLLPTGDVWLPPSTSARERAEQTGRLVVFHTGTHAHPSFPF